MGRIRRKTRQPVWIMMRKRKVRRSPGMTKRVGMKTTRASIVREMTMKRGTTRIIYGVLDEKGRR
jgi:hypothetical protein